MDRANGRKRGGGSSRILDAQDTSCAMVQNHRMVKPRNRLRTPVGCKLAGSSPQRLEEESRAKAKALFSGTQAIPHNEQGKQFCAEVAHKLGITENNVKVTVHRLRQRWVSCFGKEIARTAVRQRRSKKKFRISSPCCEGTESSMMQRGAQIHTTRGSAKCRFH